MTDTSYEGIDPCLVPRDYGDVQESMLTLHERMAETEQRIAAAMDRCRMMERQQEGPRATS